MGVSVVRTYKLSTNGGQVLYLDEKEAQSLVVSETKATLVCDSSKCAGRNKLPEAKTVSWVEEEIQKDVTKIPDGLHEFVAFGQGKVACCPQCIRDYFQYDFVRPPSPKELRAKLEADKEKQAEELKALNPHLRAPEEKPKKTWSEAMAEVQPDGRTTAQTLYDDEAEVVQNRTNDESLRGVIGSPAIHTELTENGLASMPAVDVPALCQESTPDATGFSE